MRYRILEGPKSDVSFEAYGNDLKELFENAAEALFSIICDIKNMRPEKEIEIYVKGSDVQDLMFNWLQELIAIVDVDEMFLSKFVIEEIDENHLKAKCYGEPITPEKGELVVKAVTYHNFGVKKKDGKYVVTATLDI